MFMLLYVSRNVDQSADMLNVWVKAGVQGVTILESAGMQQVGEEGGIREDVGLVFSLKSLMRAQEVHHRTLFSAIQDQETLDRVIAASTDFIGDWSRPDVGVMFVWPLTHAFGLEKTFKRR